VALIPDTTTTLGGHSQMRSSRNFRLIPRRYSFTELPAMPATLTELSVEDLTALEGELTNYFAERRAETQTPVLIEELTTVVGNIRSVRTELAGRTSPDYAADLAALDAELAAIPAAAVPEGTGDGTEGGEVIVHVTPVIGELDIAASGLTIDSEALGRGIAAGLVEANAAIRASGAPEGGEPMEIPGRGLISFRPRSAEPVVISPAMQTGDAPTSVITAAADIPGLPTGSQLDSMDQLRDAFASRWGSLGQSNVVHGEKVGIARVTAQYPEDRIIKAGSHDLVRQVEHITSPDVVMASGGLCAPVAPLYTQIVIANDMRPVAEALPTFAADRGGVRYIPPPTLSSLQASSPDPNPYFLGDAIGVESVAEDAAGGTKLCLDVPCNDIAEVDIEIIWRCLQFANVTSRTFPEQVEAFIRLAAAGWAQAAEQVLLDGIKNASTPVTLAKTFGTARQVLAQLGQAAAYLRNHNRTDPKLTVRVLLPAWVRDAMRADMTNTFAGSMDFFSYADALIDSQLAEYGIVASWYIDTPTGSGQLFEAAVSGSALPSYPATIEVFMFFEGNFLHLDAGILDLGIIRDSTLTALNKFRNFGESFENVVFIGPEALAMTLTTCPDGGLAEAYVIGMQACA
jgi:hypothetical protein